MITTSYQRLINLVTLPSLPTPVLATHDTSSYRNLYIPAVKCQRLHSIDTRLVVIGPNSTRHRIPKYQDLPAVDIHHSEKSSVLNASNSPHASIEQVSSEGQKPDIAPHSMSDYSYPAGNKLHLGNLGNITEEAEVSYMDTVISGESESARSFANSQLQTPYEQFSPTLQPLSESDTSILMVDSNNNADQEDSSHIRKKPVGSRFGRSSRQLLPYNPHSALVQAQNLGQDLTPQFIGISDVEHLASRGPRGSSVIDLNQRPSTFGVIASRQNLSGRHSRTPSLAKTTSQHGALLHGSVPHTSDVYPSNKVKPDTKQSSVVKPSFTLPGILHRVAEPNFTNGSSKVTTFPQSKHDVHQLKNSSTVTYKTGSNTSKPNMSTASLNTFTRVSEESFDIKNLQAHLKKGIGLALGQQDKALLTSMRDSGSEEVSYHRGSVDIDAEKGRTERLNSVDGRWNIPIRTIGRLSRTSVLDMTHENDKLSSLPMRTRTEKQEKREVVRSRRGSVQSLMDLQKNIGPSQRGVPRGEHKHRKNAEGLPQRISILSMDARARDTTDNRFGIADRLDTSRLNMKHPYRSLHNSRIDSDLFLMTVAAADGSAGPFKKAGSIIDGHPFGCLSASDVTPYEYLSFGMLPYQRRSIGRDNASHSYESLDLIPPYHGIPATSSKCVQVKIPINSTGTQTLDKAIHSSLEMTNILIASTREKGFLSDSEHLQHAYTPHSKREQSDDVSVTSREKILSIDQSVGLSPKRQHSDDTSADQLPGRDDSHSKKLTTPHMESAINQPFQRFSNTIIPEMTTTTTLIMAGSSSRAYNLESHCFSDSDIDTLLYVGDTYPPLSKSEKHKRNHIEVKVIDTETGDSESFVWRWNTMKTMKNSPITNCTGISENDLTVLLKEIMQEARSLTSAEKCSVFLLEGEASDLVAKVFDGDIADDQEVRISATEGIAGHVVQTGKILNIKDAYSHPLFYRGVDETTGFKTRNILCFPIKDEQDSIIGAAQLCNKIGDSYFTSVDEDIARALSAYCCISIVHSLMYRDVLDAHNRVKLASELMVFHMHVPDTEVSELLHRAVPALSSFGESLQLHSLNYSLPRSVDVKDMPLAVLSMFHELDFIKAFKIKPVTLARFVLMVKKGYRDPPYHNWTHAFSVAHFAYLLMTSLKCIQQGVLEDIEGLAFLVAALCHDIDHRGTSNSFQVASNSVLAALYSSEGSVMERHHFSQTMCILNTEGCNIFENVSRRDYECLLDLMREIILSTDIAHHLRIRNGLEAMSEEGFDKANAEHKSLLMCLFMTASDLCDQTKPWKAAKSVSKMLYKEFFSQGDLEKALGRSPMEMMDRERAFIPNLQIGFIDHIVMPAYSTLKMIYPQTQCLVDNILANRGHWMAIKCKAEERGDSLTSLEVYDFIDAEEEQEESCNKA